MLARNGLLRSRRQQDERLWHLATIAAGHDHYRHPVPDGKNEPGLLEQYLRQWQADDHTAMPGFPARR
ncbi:MAG: hypothetical protein IPH82_19920 [Chloroflexi bacterium]|nr:hypothetical protein [Chloroflexota bacterium]